MRVLNGLLLALLTTVLASACASMDAANKQRQSSSVLSYLYAGAQPAPPPDIEPVAEIHVPIRLGIAFVPDANSSLSGLSEHDRLRLAQKVRVAFVHYPFVAGIQTVPSEYLVNGGGFANLDRIASMLQLDQIALVSYDQVQHADATGWSFLYWTGIGAYAIDGDQYDILTVVDTAVIDIRSRRLLLRADGMSKNRGTSSWVNFSRDAREARSRGFEEAFNGMIGRLQTELAAFRKRAPMDPSVRLVLPPDYRPEAEQAAAR